MRTIVVNLERRYQAPIRTVWDVLVDPMVTAPARPAVQVMGMTGAPGTVGFAYTALGRGGRLDRSEVVEADAPRRLRELVRTDLLTAAAPGRASRPAEQLTVLTADAGGTLLRRRLTAPAPWWAGPYPRWAARRTVAATLRRVNASLDVQGP